VAEVSVASLAADLDAYHPVAFVDHFGDMQGIEWLIETRPTGAGLELRIGFEQRQAAQAASLGAGGLVVQQRAAKGALRPLMENDASLFSRQTCCERVAFAGAERAQVVAACRALGCRFFS
jgi:hypothetical protein